MSIRRAQDERLEGTPDGLTAVSEIMDFPDAPTALTATNVGTSRAYNNGAASVAVTPAVTGGTPATYNVISTPGSFTASGASPVTVTGLQSQTSYTFQATGVTSTSVVGIQSAASASITATTVPQAPTIGTATAGNASATVTYTANATGGAAVSTYTATSSPGGFTGTGASPITVSGLSDGTAYTFTVTATNANGTSAASSASNSATTAYAVGNTGPGGGIIFYDAGSTLSWGRYLEAATSASSPSWTDPNNIAWSAIDAAVDTSASIGTGMSNTLAMVASNSTAGYAGTRCRAYAGGGYSSSTTGWFLPSKDELYQLWTQRSTVGGFVGTYWSSTGATTTAAWVQEMNVSSPNAGSTTKNSAAFKIRPVRAF